MIAKALGWKEGVLYLSIVSLGLSLGWASIYGFRAALQPSVPELTGEKLVDFGSVNVGQELAASFYLENVGRAPLTVDSVKSDCACAIVSPSVTEVAAGGQMEVAFRYKPDTRIGQHETTMVILSQELPPVTLRARAYILAGYPERVDLGRVGPGMGTELIIPIHSASGQDFRFERITYDRTLFDVSSVEEDGAGSPRHLKVVLRGSAPVGLFSETLELSTDDTLMMHKSIILVGEVLPWVRAVPDVLEWDFRTAHEGAAPRLYLEGEQGNNIVVQSVHFRGSPIAFHVETEGENHAVNLAFPELKTLLSEQLEEGKLDISGNCGKNAFQIQVTFFGLWANAV